MVKLLKKVSVFVVMLFAIVSTCLGDELPVYARDTTDISICVTYGQTEARGMLTAINAFRQGNDAWYWDESNSSKVYSNNLNPLAYDYDLENAAMQRALELAVIYSHTRPNGESWSTAQIAALSGYSRAENIAAGYVTADDVFKGWREDDQPYATQRHRRAMLHPFYKSVGIGHVIYNGRHFWAQEFSSRPANTIQTAANNSTQIKKVPVGNSSISRIGVSVDKISLTAGETYTIPDTGFVAVKLTDGSIKNIEDSYSILSGDEKIVRVEGNQIKAISAGTATLTVSCLGRQGNFVVAVFAPITTYTVRFHGNSGLPNEDFRSVPKGSRIGTLPYATKEQFAFMGWNTDSYGRGIMITESYIPKGNEVFYAIWEQNVCKKIEATYIGGKKNKGEKVYAKDFEVTAIYADGTRKKATYYRVEDGLLRNEGENLIEVIFNSKVSTIVPVCAESSSSSSPSLQNSQSNTIEQANDNDVTLPESLTKIHNYILSEGKVYRLLNTNSGEHFFTLSNNEKNVLVSNGWKYEGIAWESGESLAGSAVFRLYNTNSGEHFYTMNMIERRSLISSGWNDEGVAWYSDGAECTPIYRLYNPRSKAISSHHYTSSKAERDYLMNYGWRYEGIAWYGCAII